MTINPRDPAVWEAVARHIVTDEQFHYDTSDTSHCWDLAQIVLTAYATLSASERGDTPCRRIEWRYLP